MDTVNTGAPSAEAPSETPQGEVNEPKTSSKPETSTSGESKSSESLVSAADKALKKFKVKIDGNETEVDESELIKGYQTSKAAMKRFEEASKKEKEHARFIEKLKANPAEVLNDPKIGKNARQWAEEFLAEELRKEMMSPEQRKLMEYEQKVKEYEEQQRAMKEQEEQQKMAQLEAKYAEELQTKFIDILDKSDLPKSPYVVKKMASLMYAAMQEGIDADVTPEMYVRIVREELKKDMNDMIRSLGGEQLLGFFGNDVVEKIRKADLEAARKKGIVKESKPIVSPTKSDTSKKKITMEEFRKMLEED